MKICFIAGYYYPEVTADVHLNLTLCEGLRGLGHEVHVITPYPSRGLEENLKKKYRDLKYEVTAGGVIIHRVGYQSNPKQIMLKGIDWLLKMFFLLHKAKSIDADVFIIMSTPPMLGVLGGCLNQNAKKIYRLQDIFPDNLVITDKIKANCFLFKILKKLEGYMYQTNDLILTISNDMKEHIQKDKDINDKVEVVYNWIDCNKCKPVKWENNILVKKWKLSEEKFYVVYAGNMGIAQNVETILKAALKVEDYEDIEFIMIGDGAKKNDVVKFLNHNNCKNVKLYSMQPIELVSHVYSIGDVGIVSLKGGVSRVAMPSKTWSIMAAGRAVICEIDSYSELNNIISSNECGYTCEPGNYNEMAERIIQLYREREQCRIMGENSRKYIEKNLTIEQSINKFNDIMEKISSC